MKKFLIFLALICLVSFANAQQTIKQNGKQDSTQVYPYLLSVDPGVTLIMVNGTYKLPMLHYKKITATKTKIIMIRAAWNKQGKRTECNAGIDSITLVATSGTLDPKKWGNALELLLAAFGLKGSGIISFAMFDYGLLISASKNKMSLETTRLSPWLNVSVTFK